MLSPHFNRAYFSCMLGRAPKRLRIFFMDKVRRLEMVVRAADLGGFAAAAKHMNITPSAVSRGVAELERTLRISIFNRSTRQMQLTQEGRELYYRALDVLERLAAIEVTANRSEERRVGKGRVC